MATAREVVEIGLKYVGVKESPANSNNVVFNTDYYGREVYDGLWGTYFPWCVTYIWDIFRLAGASKLFYDGDKTASCPTVDGWARNRGLTVDKSKAKYGDLVLFDWDSDNSPDHIGFILENYGNGSYKTLEGNTAVGNDSNGGEVMIRTRYSSSILRVIRPKYDDSVNDDDDTLPGAVDENTVNINLGLVSRGTNSNSARVVMVILKDKGYYTDDLESWDNLIGDKADKAIREFQKDCGIESDGIVGDITWKALLTSSVVKKESTTEDNKSNNEGDTVTMELRMLSKGMSGNDVRAALVILKDKGYYTDYLADGDDIFGPKMDAAVRKMQREQNLGADGIIGTKSWTYLLK